MYSAEQRASKIIANYFANSYILLLTLVLFISGGFLTFVAFNDATQNNSCDASNCISSGCTVANCNQGQCLYSKVSGCCDETYCDGVNGAIYKFDTIFAINLTSNNINDSFSNPTYIEDVEF